LGPGLYVIIGGAKNERKKHLSSSAAVSAGLYQQNLITHNEVKVELLLQYIAKEAHSSDLSSCCVILVLDRSKFTRFHCYAFDLRNMKINQISQSRNNRIKCKIKI
jgi:hypothetical protein